MRRQNIILKFFLSLSFCVVVHSETQAQNAIETMLEQIAKLQVYINFLENGYQIADKGLTFIGDIKKGDINLHTNYFNSLETVNPQVKNDVEVADIIAMEIQMASDYKSYYKSFQSGGVFSSSELSYLSSVYGSLLNDIATEIDDLTRVLTDGNLQMKDNERINRINKLFKQVSDQYEFFYSFSHSTQIQSAQRKKEILGLDNIKKLLQP